MRQQVNLYQPVFRKQEKKFSAKAMLQAIAVVFVGVALILGWTMYQVSVLRNEVVRTDQQFATVSKRLSEVTEHFSGSLKTQSLDAEIARLEQELATRGRVREVLGRGIFSNTSGFAGYLAAFARQPQPGLWLTGFDIVGSAEQVTLQGRSVTPEGVPRYVQKLSAEQRLAGIEFQVFQISRPANDSKTAYVDFTLRTADAAQAKTP